MEPLEKWGQSAEAELRNAEYVKRMAEQRKAFLKLVAQTIGELILTGCTMFALAYLMDNAESRGILRALAVLALIVQTFFLGKAFTRWFAVVVRTWSAGCIELTHTPKAAAITGFSAIVAFVFGIPCLSMDPYLGVALLMIGSGCVGALTMTLMVIRGEIHGALAEALAHRELLQLRRVTIERMRSECTTSSADPNDTLDDDSARPLHDFSGLKDAS